METDKKTTRPKVIFLEPEDEQKSLAQVPKPLVDIAVDPVVFDRQALINLSKLLESPLQDYKIIERVGRCRLVEYQPINRPDPMMPIPGIVLPAGLVDPLRHLSRLVGRWTTEFDQTMWHRAALAYINKCQAQINRYSDLFDPQEITYMNDRLLWLLVDPTGSKRI